MPITSLLSTLGTNLIFLNKLPMAGVPQGLSPTTPVSTPPLLPVFSFLLLGQVCMLEYKVQKYLEKGKKQFMSSRPAKQS